MELDAKQKLLIAIYTEYQKDVPEMKKNIKYELLGFEKNVFKIALEKLTNEGLINGVRFIKGGDTVIPIHVFVDNCKMSNSGIDYVENKLGIKPDLSGAEKVKEVMSKGANWGWEQIKDIGSRVLSDIIKTQAGIKN